MKRMRLITVLCTAFILCMVLMNGGITAMAATTEITLQTDEYEINNGDELTVSIYINSDTAIGAYHAEVIYDKYRLMYVGGGENQVDDRIILEGTGYGNDIVYKLTFRAISGGNARISCGSADIRVQGLNNSEKQTVSVRSDINIAISGEDTATKAWNTDKYGIASNIPLCGVVDVDEHTRYYIVDLDRYIPEEVSWDYELVEDKYEDTEYTFLTNKANEVRLLYMIDAEESFVMYAYSKEKASLYPCVEEDIDGETYYVMSANVCVSWPEDLTLDYVKKANVCYVMSSDGTCGFYRYEGGSFIPWSEEDGKAFVEDQMKVFYIILAVAGAIIVIIVAAACINALAKRQAKKRRAEEMQKIGQEPFRLGEKKERTARSVQDFATQEIEFIDINKIEEHAAYIHKQKPVIAVKNVTMRFRISTSDASGIKEYFIQKIKKQITYRELLALDDISFNVYKGEVVGIIGTNGSGKSTLLRIVSGALNPTEGKVLVNRRKLQLLTLGTGFDMELTARENIYLNGAIIGYSEEFIRENFDKIVEFAELGDFIDEKVKNFSSGMVSRLGFAIATIGEAAEILILDEVLSVGDEFFKKKSLKRIKEMIHGGSTVLMVSHGMNTIIENCTKVVWIEKGKLRMIGDAKEVCEAYRNMNQ